MNAIQPVTGEGKVVVSPILAAFVTLRNEGILRGDLPRTVNALNFLDKSPSILTGISQADAAILATRGIRSVRDLVEIRTADALTDLEPGLVNTLRKAHDGIRAAFEKYDIQVAPHPVTQAISIDPVTGETHKF